MISNLTAAFGAGVSTCATPTSAPLIEVFDKYDGIPTERRSYIRTLAHQPFHFTLENPQQAKLVFTALDNCLFNVTDSARCDFMIGNLQKLFFVEIKNGNVKHRRRNRADAIDQLDSTLRTMKAEIDLEHTELIAVVCQGAKKAHPTKTAEGTNKVVLFQQQHNADLREGNKGIF